MADEADEQRCQEEAARAAASAEMALAKEQRRCKAAECATALATKALAEEQRRQESADHTAVSAESTLANKRHCREAAEHATALAELALAKERRRREAVERATALAESVLAKERRHRETAERAAMLAESALVAEQHCHESAERATASATKALAKDKYDNGNYAKAGKYPNDDYAKAGKYTKDGYNNGHYTEAGKYAKDEYDDNDYNESLANIVKYNKDDDIVARRIEAYAAPFFACVDAIMAKIQVMDDCFGNWAAFGNELHTKEDNKASAPTMPPLAPPTAVLSPPHCPTSHVDAVLSTMGGSSQATSLTLAPAALPSPAVDGQLRTVRQCAQPCCRVGQRHGPRAPNPQVHILCGR